MNPIVSTSGLVDSNNRNGQNGSVECKSPNLHEGFSFAARNNFLSLPNHQN